MVHDFPEDVAVLRRVLTGNGIACTPDEAHEIWCMISADHQAGWLCLPLTDPAVWEILKPYVTEV